MTAPTIEALIEAVLAKKQGNKELLMTYQPADADAWVVGIGGSDKVDDAMLNGEMEPQYACAAPTLWAALTDLLEKLP